MADTGSENKIEKEEGPLATLKRWGKYLLSAGSVAAIVVFIFQNFILMPVIRYDKNTGEFTIATEFRNVTMHIRPQMVVRCGDTVIILTHLQGYCEHETIYFSDGKASLTKANQQYADRLLSYVRTAVQEELQADGYSVEQIEEINEQLFIYMTMLCGITYETRFGNSAQRYCIIENDGILLDCSHNSGKVQERLFDYELKIADAAADSISTSEEVYALICAVVEEIETLTPQENT